MAIHKEKSRFMFAILAIIGFVGLILFSLPLRMGILNEGNRAGLIASLLLVLYGFAYRRVNGFIAILWKYTAARVVLWAVLGFAALSVLSALVLTGFMIHAAGHVPETPQTVIVLGCKVNGTTPSLTLASRLDTAARYLTENQSAAVIVSGGCGEDEEVAESEVMRAYLEAKGIEPGRIYEENGSVSTEDNIAFSLRLAEDEGLGGNVTIISSEFHVLRAVIIAKKLGTDAYGLGAPTPWYLLPTYYVRELFALAQEIALK